MYKRYLIIILIFKIFILYDLYSIIFYNKMKIITIKKLNFIKCKYNIRHFDYYSLLNLRKVETKEKKTN